MNYEQGLETLRHYAENTNWYLDFVHFETQLRENLGRERRHGSTEQNRASRAQIVEELNLLTYNYLSVTFTDLCRGMQVNAAVLPNNVKGTRQARDQGQNALHSAQSQTSTSPRNGAFISYDDHDQKDLEELQTFLKPYIRKYDLQIWDNTSIPPGGKWHDETEKALRSAKVAVLLISPDFLASDSIINNELPPLLAAAEQEGAIILSVILRTCAFEHSELARFKPVNNPAKPLNSMKPSEKDKVWARVAELVRDGLSKES